MKKLILMSKAHKREIDAPVSDNNWCNRWALFHIKNMWLERMMLEHLGFEAWGVWDIQKHTIDWGRVPKGAYGVDVGMVMLAEQPHRIDQKGLFKFLDIYPDAKFVLYVLGDYRFWKRYNYEMRPLVERCDLILDWQKHNYREDAWFENVYPEHAHKHKFFPHCLAPYDNWMNVEFNEDPISKCLFTGRVGTRYHLRNHFLEQVLQDKELRDITAICKDGRADHIGDFSTKEARHYFELDFVNDGYVVKDDYIKMLNSYRCTLTGSTFRKHLLGKYFEIPGSGSLLIADRCPDADLAGFKPGYHYIDVTKETVVDVVKDVCSNPEKYLHIRQFGYEFVRKEHNLEKRFMDLTNYLIEMCND